MNLTKVERLLIVNQFKILENLYPDEAKYYAQQRKAVEYGYTLHYDVVFDALYNEMSQSDCQEVLDILSMYRALTFSYQALSNKKGIEEDNIRFEGFDGNEETSQYLYAKYFILDLERFDELTYGEKHPEFNSHAPKLRRYREMLAVWRSYTDNHNLNKEQIINILRM